jgi:hypothetical protein
VSSGASSRDVVGTELAKRALAGRSDEVRAALRTSLAAEDALNEAMAISSDEECRNRKALQESV